MTIIIDKNNSKNKKQNIEEIENNCIIELIEKKDYHKLPECCEDFKFVLLYQIYWEDLSFQSKYYSRKGLAPELDEKEIIKVLQNTNLQNGIFCEENEQKDTEKLIKLGFLIPISDYQIEIDKVYFDKVLLEWKDKLKNCRFNTKLKDTQEETTKIIKNVKKDLKNKGLDEHQIECELKKVYWKSKYIHYLSEKIFEEIEEENKSPLIFILNGDVIYFTFKSLIHILNRHYGYLLSNEFYKSTKSYYQPNFHYEKTHLILNEIFTKLNNSKDFKDVKVQDRKYCIRFKNIIYDIYLKKDKDQLIISTFYPRERNLEELNSKILIEIDSELSFYKL